MRLFVQKLTCYFQEMLSSSIFEVDQFASYHHSDDKMRMMMTGTVVLYAKHQCSTKDKQFDQQNVKSSGVQSKTFSLHPGAEELKKLRQQTKIP